MRGFIIAAVLFVVLMIFFGAGLFGSQSGLMLVSFCGSPFVLFALGWSTRGLLAGRRLALVEAQQAQRGVNGRRAPRRVEAETL